MENDAQSLQFSLQLIDIQAMCWWVLGNQLFVIFAVLDVSCAVNSRINHSFYRQPCRYCFYSLAQKWVFRPAGATRCPCGPLPRANFHVYRGKNVGIQPPKLSKFRILARNLYLRGDSFAIFFYEILIFCTRLQIHVAFKFLVWSLSRDKQSSYKHFPRWGHFPTNFQQPLAANY